MDVPHGAFMRSVSDAQVSCAERGEKITGGCFFAN